MLYEWLGGGDVFWVDCRIGWCVVGVDGICIFIYLIIVGFFFCYW